MTEKNEKLQVDKDQEKKAPKKTFVEPKLERHEKLPEVTGFSF